MHQAARIGIVAGIWLALLSGLATPSQGRDPSPSVPCPTAPATAAVTTTTATPNPTPSPSVEPSISRTAATEFPIIPLAPPPASSPPTAAWRGDWRRLPPSPLAPRTDASTAYLPVDRGRSIVVWGGIGADGAPLADGAVLDLEHGRWRLIPQGPLCPRTGYGFAADGFGNIDIWGGIGADGTALGDGAEYDVRERTWRSLPPSPLPAGPAAMGGNGNGMYAVVDDPAGGPPLVSELTWTEDGDAPACCSIPWHHGMTRYWTDPTRAPVPRGARYEMLEVDLDGAALLVSHVASGEAFAARYQPYWKPGWTAVGQVPAPATGGAALDLVEHRAAWLGVTYGTFVDLWQPAEPWPATSVPPDATSGDPHPVWSPRRIISAQGLAAYDVFDGRWLRLPVPIGGARTGASVAWASGQLYVWGGRTSDGVVRDTGWIFAPRLTPHTVALPETTFRGGCDAGGSQRGRLRLAGSRSDPMVTWFETRTGRLPILWPDGYFARFRPRLVVYAPDGTAVARAGDIADQAHFRFNDLFLCIAQNALIEGRVDVAPP